MIRKSLMAAGVAFALATAPAQAAIDRVGTTLGPAEGIDEDDYWIMPVASIALIIFIILVTGDGDGDDEDPFPVSP